MILNTENGEGRLGSCNGRFHPHLNLSKTHIYFNVGRAFTISSCLDKHDSIE